MLFAKDLSQKRLNFLASRLFWPNTGSGKQTSKDNLIGLAKTFDFFTTNLQIISSRLVSHKDNKRQTIDIAIQPNVFINTYVSGEISLSPSANSQKTKGKLSKKVEFNDLSLQFMPSYRPHIEWMSKKQSGLQAYYACGKDGGHIFFFSQMRLTDNEKAPWVYLEYGYRIECTKRSRPIVGLYASVRVDDDENVPDIVKLKSGNCSEQKTCEVLHKLIDKAIRSASKRSSTVKRYSKKVELKPLTLS